MFHSYHTPSLNGPDKEVLMKILLEKTKILVNSIFPVPTMLSETLS